MQHSGQEVTKDGETPQSARFWKLLLQVGGPAAGPRESAREKDHHGERFNPSKRTKIRKGWSQYHWAEIDLLDAKSGAIVFFPPLQHNTSPKYHHLLFIRFHSVGTPKIFRSGQFGG